MSELLSPPDPRADELLAIRCQLGERAAFDTLVARFQQPLWRYARNLTGSDAAADDASQEVWLRALRGIVRLRDGALQRGEALTSMYLRVNDTVFDPATEAALEQAEVIEDPLIRCLFNGVFGAYQAAQLARLLA